MVQEYQLLALLGFLFVTDYAVHVCTGFRDLQLVYFGSGLVLG